MTEQELEKLFKSKLGSTTYVYNPAAWHAMENLLDQKATRGGAYFWRAAAAILLFATAAASLNFWQSREQLPGSDNVANQDTQIQIEEESTELLTPLKPELSVSSNELSTEQADQVSPADPETGRAAEILKDEPPVARPSTSIVAENTSAEADQALPAEIENEVKEVPALIAENNDMTRTREELDWVNLNPKSADAGSIAAVAGTPRSAVMQIPDYRRIRQGLYLKGGTILNESYNTGDMGVGFHVGLEYQMALSRNLDLSAGVNFSRINKLGIHQEYDSTFYHFSSERIETEITGRQLNYLEMPLSVNWRIHPRHQLGFGGYASLLLSVSEDVEKRHYHQNEEMSVQRHVEEGLLSPYESYDMGLNASYFYLIDQQLELGLEFRYGLVDITRDLESVYTKNHQNLNTRISLRYRIL